MRRLPLQPVNVEYVTGWRDSPGKCTIDNVTVTVCNHGSLSEEYMYQGCTTVTYSISTRSIPVHAVYVTDRKKFLIQWRIPFQACFSIECNIIIRSVD